MPGIGPLLGAEFLAAIGSDLASFASPDRLAAFAGLAPTPHDSGKRKGNLHRPRRHHRGLQRIFYMSALTSVRYDPNSRRFYDRKRAEGRRHNQAVIALDRRRVNVLWAVIRDRHLYEVAPPRPTGQPSPAQAERSGIFAWPLARTALSGSRNLLVGSGFMGDAARVIEREAAVRIAEEELDREYQKWSAAGVDSICTAVVHVEEHELVWIIYWQSVEFMRTRNPSAMLIGNGPYLVDRTDGGLHQIGVVSAKGGEWEADYRVRIRGLAVRTPVDDLHDEYVKSPPRAGACRPCALCGRGCRCCLLPRPSST